MKTLLLTIGIAVLLLSSTASLSAVRYNPLGGYYEGNICMNNLGWQYVNWQPLGSLCRIQLPGYPPMQGIIVNL
jgi:hypothetical protein